MRVSFTLYYRPNTRAPWVSTLWSCECERDDVYERISEFVSMKTFQTERGELVALKRGMPASLWTLLNLRDAIIMPRTRVKIFQSDEWKRVKSRGRRVWQRHNPKQLQLRTR